MEGAEKYIESIKKYVEGIEKKSPAKQKEILREVEHVFVDMGYYGKITLKDCLNGFTNLDEKEWIKTEIKVIKDEKKNEDTEIKKSEDSTPFDLDVERIEIEIEPYFPLLFESDELVKGMMKVNHKYIRREGSQGQYRYIYFEKENTDGTTYTFEDDKDEARIREGVINCILNTKGVIEIDEKYSDETAVIFKNPLTNIEIQYDNVPIKDDEVIKEKKLEFANELYNKVFQVKFEKIVSCGTDKVERVKENGEKVIEDVELYDNFEGQPIEATQFMLQNYMKNQVDYDKMGDLKMRCRNVMKVEGIPVDFTCGFLEKRIKIQRDSSPSKIVDVGEGIYKLVRKHLVDFRIFKMFKTPHFSSKEFEEKKKNIKNTKIDLKYVLDTLKDTAIEKNYDKYDTGKYGKDVVYRGSNGWVVMFGKHSEKDPYDDKKTRNYLNLVTIYNEEIKERYKDQLHDDETLATKFEKVKVENKEKIIKSENNYDITESVVDGEINPFSLPAAEWFTKSGYTIREYMEISKEKQRVEKEAEEFFKGLEARKQERLEKSQRLQELKEAWDILEKEDELKKAKESEKAEGNEIKKKGNNID